MPTQVFLKNQLISNTQLKGLFHTDEDLHGMSIKPVRPHSGACNVWLRINLFKEIRGTMSGNQFKFQNPKRNRIYGDISPHHSAQPMAWDGLLVCFASYLLM